MVGIIGINGTFIVAELSANHNQSKALAIETIKAAKRAGADAVKLQTYRPDTITIDCENEYFQINHGTLWDGKTLYDLYSEAYTPWEWHDELFEVAKNEGLICFSSPFDKTAVDFLERLNCPIYKIASPEITDIPLIDYVASKGKPVILSTGISRLEDIELAVNTIRSTGNDQISILKCTSEYPASPEDANLLTIKNIGETFNVVPGISDHTLGIEAPIIAVTLGAKIVEKHFILNKSVGGLDAAFSLDFDEFRKMVEAIRKVEKLLGSINYSLNPKMGEIRKKGARSIFVIKAIKKGELFTEENIRSIRPGYGLHPKYFKEVICKRARKDLERGLPLTWDMVG
ncbi:MAG: pseudaminic acid synthase [Flavobacterium sp.]|nr:pseudaminic acid synthase [Flavobacterium sp.]